MRHLPSLDEAEATLGGLAEAFLASAGKWLIPSAPLLAEESVAKDGPDYETRYRALVEDIPAIIFVAPLEAGCGEAYISPQIERILGFTQDEWLGDPLRWYQQIHPEDKQRWSLEAADLFLSGKPLSSTYRVMARDGRVVWFRCDVRMVHAEDRKPSFIHGIGFDVTDLKEAEASLKRARDELEVRVEERTQALALSNVQLKEEIAGHKRTELELIAAKESAEAAARTKSEFLANMSHEIRTPIHGVLGMISLVLKTELSAAQREYISIANSSAESLLSVINQVLDFSKVEAGKSQLDPVNFSLRSSLEGLIKELKHQARQKGLALTYSVSPQLPDSLRGDWGRLRQVLVNLIANAIKFTSSGRVYLEVSAERVAERKLERSCELRFSIVDTGIGIPASKMKLIFEPFTQADGSITREYGGTGLGLTISRRLVEMMGGQLEAASEPGSGSTFSFVICFEITQGQGAVEFAGPARWAELEESPFTQNSLNNRSPLRILVAEDNLINQKVVAQILERLGHTLMLTTNGLEALDAYNKFSFDILLMDVQMPLMDGLSATAKIRAIEAQRGSARLPIIGLTARALRSDKTRCMEAGMDRYLAKPYTADDLMMLIEELTNPSSL